MQRLQILGVAGAVLLILGVFSPLAIHPQFGPMSMLSTGGGVAPGIILILLALGSIILTLVGRYRRLMFIAGLALLLIVLSLATFITNLRSAAADPKMAGRVAEVTFSWGWLVLVVGAASMMFAGWLGRNIPEPPRAEPPPPEVEE